MRPWVWGDVPGQEQKSQGKTEVLGLFGGVGSLDLSSNQPHTQGSTSQNRFKVLGTSGTGERRMGDPRSEVGTRTGSGSRL